VQKERDAVEVTGLLWGYDSGAIKVNIKGEYSMELIYIWIKDYKNIKEQGFNFNPDYYFELEKISEKNFKLINILNLLT
jgi:hypothetical protein